MATVEGYFARWGNWIVFFARFFAGIRAPCYFAAGMFKVNYWVFLTLDTIAALVSVPLWIWLGHWAAANYEEIKDKIEHVKTQVMIGLGVLAALLVAWWLWRRFRRRAEPATARLDGNGDGKPDSPPTGPETVAPLEATDASDPAADKAGA
jgi:membrane protein DedA with SNARE-associated domain